MDPAQNWKIRPGDEGTEQHNFDAIFRRGVLIGFVIFRKFRLAAIDRRAGGRCPRPAVDEDLCALNVGCVVGGEEQHGSGRRLPA